MFGAAGAVRRSLTRHLSAAKPTPKSCEAPLKKFEFHRLDENCLASTTTVTRDDAMKYYKDMVSIRLMEQEAGRLYMEKAIKGFCHLYSGQEACAVGVEAVISKDDSVITAYRSHGWTFTRGVSIKDILCELTGRVTGCTKGKGGSMHTYSHEFYGGNGIVGAQVPVGAGIALAHKLRANGRVCVALYGDGAANQGQVFEAFNMSELWKLPVIFICENNLFGMGTSADRAAACSLFYTRGDYIPGIRVDASCVLSVREAMRFAHKWCQSGKGPIVMELVTYRYSGHSMSDPGTSYRKVEDVQRVRKSSDPITLLGGLLTSEGLATEAELEQIKDTIQNEVDDARNHALNDPYPDLNQLGSHIYSGGTNSGTVRGGNHLTWYDSSQ